MRIDKARDQHLVAAVAAGHEGGLAEVMEAYGSLVLGVSRRVIRDPDMAEEVAQDVFMTLWNKPDAVDLAKGSLAVWLTTVARNKAVDRIRKEERAQRALDTLKVEGDVAFRHEGLEDAREVRAAVADLTYLQREALFLAYFEGLTYREVASALGIPEGTAKTRLRDALARLRTRLASVHAA